MIVTVLLPESLQAMAGDRPALQVEARTVREALKGLKTKHPGVFARVCDPGGNPRRTVEIYKDLEDIRFIDNLDTALEAGSEVKIVASPALWAGAA